MRWNLKRTKLLFALIPIMSIIFFVLTANNNIFANQSFSAFDIYMQICDTAKPSPGKNSPRDYTAAENFAIAAQVYNDTDSAQGTITGTVNALGGFYTQRVQNYHAKTGGFLFNESISLSAIASVAEQRFFKDGALLFRKGETSGSSVKSWENSVTELAPSVYRQRYGIVPWEISKYSVTSGGESGGGSIKSGKLVSENADGTFTYELILDGEAAQKYSRYEMMTFAGVSEYPTFISCRLVYTIDANWVMREVKSYDVYEIAIMNGIRCESALTEIFTYDEGFMPDRARIFIDYVPTGNTGSVDKNKGPSEYLSEAFGDYISGEKTLNLTATAEIAGETLDIAARIDIKGNDYSFAVGDKIFVKYSGNEVFVSLGENKYRVSVADITSVLNSVGVNTGGLNLDASILEKLFENHTIVETDSHVHIIMPFQLMGINLNVDMGLKKLDDGTTAADTIDAIIELGSVKVPVAIKIANDVTLPHFDENEYVSLKPALDAVANTVALKSYLISGNINAEINGNNITAMLSARIVKEKSDIAAEGNIEIFGIKADVIYKDGALFVTLGGTTVKASLADMPALVKEISALFNKSGIEAPDISGVIGRILPQILPANINVGTVINLLAGIEYSDGLFTLSATPQNGTPWTLSLAHDEILRSLSLRGLNLDGVNISAEFNLTEGNDAPVEKPEKPYIDASVVSSFIPAAEKLINSQSYSANIHGEIKISDITVPVNGTVKINRRPFAVKADITVANCPVSIVLADNIIYITADEFKASFALKDAEKITEALGISIPNVSAVFGIIKEFAQQGGFNIAELLQNTTLYSDGDTVKIEALINGLSLAAQIQPAANGINANIIMDSQQAGANLIVSVCGNDGSYLISAPNGEYFNLSSLIPFIRPVKNLLSAKSFMVRLDGIVTCGELSERLDAVITAKLENGFAVAGSARLSGAEIEFVIKDGTLYLNAGGIALKLEFDKTKDILSSVIELFGSADAFVENIANIIGRENADAALKIISAISDALSSFANGENVNASNILNKLGFVLPQLNYKSLTALLAGITVSDGKITIPVTAANGNSYNIAITADQNNITNAQITNLEIFGYTLTLNADITCGGEYIIEPEDGDYMDVATFTSLIKPLSSVLSSEKLEFSINSGRINTSVISGDISGSVIISLNPFTVTANLNFNSHKINAVFKNNTVYAAINDIRIKLDLNDINDIIAKINSFMPSEGEKATVSETLTKTLEFTSIIQNALNGKTLGDILSYINYVKSDSNGEITVSLSIGDFSLSASVYEVNGNLAINVYNFNYKSEITDSNLYAVLSPANAVEEFDLNPANYVDINQIASYLKPAINTLNENHIAINFSGSLYDAKNALTAINGEFKAERTEKFANMYAHINLSGKTDNHDIRLYLLDGTEYGDENTDIPFDIYKVTAYISYNGFTAKIDCTSALRIIGALCDILNLDIDIINELTREVYNENLDASVFETMDIAGLDTIRETLGSLFNTAEDVNGAISSGNILSGLLGLVSDSMIDDILAGTSIGFDEQGYLQIKIRNNLFNALNESSASIVIGHNGERLTYVNISNLIISGNTVNFGANVSCDEFPPIVPPVDTDTKDFTSIDDLLISVIKTASLRNFNITGNIKLDLLGIIKPTIPFDIKVKILDDGSTVAAVKLEVPFVSAVVGVGLTKTDSYIYYANNMLYFIVDVWSSWAWGEGSYKTTEMRSATIEEFIANPLEYLFYLLRMGDMLKDPISDAIAKGGNGTPSKNPNDILKHYSFNGNDFNLKIGLGELAGNSDLKDLDITLNTEDGYVSGLKLGTQFTDKKILLSLENTVLANLERLNGKITGAAPLGKVGFGKSDKVQSLGGNIDSLEDDLAILFPVEAAETFGKKAAEKADAANSAAENAKNSSQNIADCESALIEAKKEYDKASDKLASIPEGSFGYARAKAQAELTAKVLERAEEDFVNAKAVRIRYAESAANAASDAYYYARKAAEFAEVAGNQNSVRGYKAAGSAALSTITATEAALNAANEAINAASLAGEDGITALNKAKQIYNLITDSITATALRAANAANAATSATIQTAQTSANAAIAAADAAKAGNADKWFEASSYAGQTLSAIEAMTVSSKAAEKAALISDNADCMATAAAGAATAKAVANTSVASMANIAINASNAISEQGLYFAESATTVQEILSALVYAKEVLTAANSAQTAANLIDNPELAENADRAAANAREASGRIADTLLTTVNIAVTSYENNIKNAEHGLSGLNAAQTALQAVLPYLDAATEIKPYSTKASAQTYRTIYACAFDCANVLLENANSTVYSLAADKQNAISSACAQANVSFGNKDYSPITNAANALKSSVSGIAELSSSIQSITETAYAVYEKVSAVIQQNEISEIKELLKVTLSDASGLNGAARILLSAYTDAEASAQKLVTNADNLAYNWSKPLDRLNTQNAVKDAQNAITPLKDGINSAIESIEKLTEFYNGICK